MKVILLLILCGIYSILVGCTSTGEFISANTSNQKMCQKPSENYEDLPCLFDVTNIWFLDNETLGVSGWNHDANRDFAQYTSQSEFNMLTGKFRFLESSYQQKNEVPCDDCDYKIFEESPNGLWQLIQVDEGENRGIWLLSEQTKYQIIY